MSGSGSGSATLLKCAVTLPHRETLFQIINDDRVNNADGVVDVTNHVHAQQDANRRRRLRGGREGKGRVGEGGRGEGAILCREETEDTKEEEA